MDATGTQSELLKPVYELAIHEGADHDFVFLRVDCFRQALDDSKYGGSSVPCCTQDVQYSAFLHLCASAAMQGESPVLLVASICISIVHEIGNIRFAEDQLSCQGAPTQQSDGYRSRCIKGMIALQLLPVRALHSPRRRGNSGQAILFRCFFLCMWCKAPLSLAQF